jgi:hypothetical protein
MSNFDSLSYVSKNKKSITVDQSSQNVLKENTIKRGSL